MRRRSVQYPLLSMSRVAAKGILFRAGLGARVLGPHPSSRPPDQLTLRRRTISARGGRWRAGKLLQGNAGAPTKLK